MVEGGLWRGWPAGREEGLLVDEVAEALGRRLVNFRSPCMRMFYN